MAAEIFIEKYLYVRFFLVMYFLIHLLTETVIQFDKLNELHENVNEPNPNLVHSKSHYFSTLFGFLMLK